MTKKIVENQVVTGLIQLMLIAVSVIVGYYFTREYSIIPRAVLHLPDVYVSQSEMWQIVQIFGVVYVLQIALSAFLNKTPGFSSAKRFANEYIAYLYAYTTASLYLFLATTINYDPQLVAAIGLFSSLLYFSAFVLLQLISGGSFGSTLGGGIGALFKRLVSISGVLALVYFLVPLAMGKAFTTDRDVANVITQVRIWFNPVDDTDWGFKNKLPGQAFAQPVLTVQAPGDDDSLYVLERVGRVYKASLSGAFEPELVLDVFDAMGEVEVENGAVGFAFHPAYADEIVPTTLYLYVLHRHTP